MIQTILTWAQPFTIIAFIISGICCLLLRQWNTGIINFLLGTINFFIFYGNKIFQR